MQAIIIDIHQKIAQGYVLAMPYDNSEPWLVASNGLINMLPDWPNKIQLTKTDVKEQIDFKYMYKMTENGEGQRLGYKEYGLDGIGKDYWVHIA